MEDEGEDIITRGEKGEDVITTGEEGEDRITKGGGRIQSGFHPIINSIRWHFRPVSRIGLQLIYENCLYLSAPLGRHVR